MWHGELRQYTWNSGAINVRIKIQVIRHLTLHTEGESIRYTWKGGTINDQIRNWNIYEGNLLIHK